jgi:hypothetical protein
MYFEFVLFVLITKKQNFDEIGKAQGECREIARWMEIICALTICKGAVRQGLSKFLLFSKRTVVIAD